MTAGFLAGYSPLTLSGLGQPSDPETPPPVSPRCARDVALRFVAQPEFEDGLGAVQAPAGAGDVHAVFDQVAAGTFDDAGGDRPARGQRARVVEVLLLVVQVVGGGVGVSALLGSQATAGVFAADRGGDQAGVAGQDLQCFVSDPFLRVWVAFGVEAPGGFPHVLQDVDEVDDDAQVDVPGAGLCGDLLDLVVVAVHEGDPGPGVVGVTTFGLVEHRGDDRSGVRGDAGGQPLADGAWPGDPCRGVPRCGGGLGDDVARGPWGGDDLEDRADLGHPLAVAFLALGQSGGQVRPGGGL